MKVSGGGRRGIESRKGVKVSGLTGVGWY